MTHYSIRLSHFTELTQQFNYFTTNRLDYEVIKYRPYGLYSILCVQPIHLLKQKFKFLQNNTD